MISTLSGLASIGQSRLAILGGVVFLFAAACVIVSWPWQAKRHRKRGILLAPVALDYEGINWGRAPVYSSPLVIKYRPADGEVFETVIQPKNIQGVLTSSKKVRPEILIAFCETHQSLYPFKFGGIVWIADFRTGDLIEDIYHYLGNAQPGGAPALDYVSR